MKESQDKTLIKPAEFLNEINGKEIKLDTKYENKHIYLLIYPQELIKIEIEIIKDCVTGYIHYNEVMPYKHLIGAIQDGELETILGAENVFYELIQNTLKSNGLIDEYYGEDNIIFDEDCFNAVKNTLAVIDVDDNGYDVEIFSR